MKNKTVKLRAKTHYSISDQSVVNKDCWNITLDTLTDVNNRGGCHTTYVFADTVERCTGTPSPELETCTQLAEVHGQKRSMLVEKKIDNEKQNWQTEKNKDNEEKEIYEKQKYEENTESRLSRPDSGTDNVTDDWCLRENKSVSNQSNRSLNDWIVVSSREKKYLPDNCEYSGQSQSYTYGQILLKNVPADRSGFLNGKYSDFSTCHYPFTITNGSTVERTYDEPCVDLPRSRSWLCCPGSRPVTSVQSPQKCLEKVGQDVISTPPTSNCSEHCVCYFYI